MQLVDRLYGFGDLATARQAATLALLDAAQAIAALDQQLVHHPLARTWARAERELAIAAAAGEARPGSADAETIIRARLGLSGLADGQVALGELDDRARRWERLRQRKGPAELRALVGTLTAERGSRNLVGLADRIAAALATVATASWELTRDADGGCRLTVDTGTAIDTGDVALAVPYALRRLGVSRILLPTLSGRVRTLRVSRQGSMSPDGAADDLAPLTRWAGTLATQAHAAATRLHRLEAYVAMVERQLVGVKRPQALRRLVGVGLSSWGLWAAALARVTDVELSSAWRTLGQAAELGIVEAVPRGPGGPGGPGRPGKPGRTDGFGGASSASARDVAARGVSVRGAPGAGRGDGSLYAIPPWLRLAGLSPAPRGRPAVGAAAGLAAELAAGQGGLTATAAAMDEAAAAIADLDRLLARAPR